MDSFWMMSTDVLVCVDRFLRSAGIGVETEKNELTEINSLNLRIQDLLQRYSHVYEKKEVTTTDGSQCWEIERKGGLTSRTFPVKTIIWKLLSDRGIFKVEINQKIDEEFYSEIGESRSFQQTHVNDLFKFLAKSFLNPLNPCINNVFLNKIDALLQFLNEYDVHRFFKSDTIIDLDKKTQGTAIFSITFNPPMYTSGNTVYATTPTELKNCLLNCSFDDNECEIRITFNLVNNASKQIVSEDTRNSHLNKVMKFDQLNIKRIKGFLAITVGAWQ